MPLPHEPGPHWGEVGIHGIARPREWDAVATVSAPELAGDTVSFVYLPDGRTVLEGGDPGGDVDSLARALAEELPPPFRAEAVRRAEDLWAVAGRAIQTVDLPADLTGSMIELTWDGRDRVLRIDGVESPLAARELERLGADRYRTYVVRAARLVGETWDVSVEPL